MLMIEAGPGAVVALDLAVHLASGHHAGHSGPAHLAHIVAIVGMVLVLAGVVVHGARRHALRRRRGAQGGLRDAHR